MIHTTQVNTTKLLRDSQRQQQKQKQKKIIMKINYQ